MSAGPIAPPFDEGDARAIVQAFEEAWNRRIADEIPADLHAGYTLALSRCVRGRAGQYRAVPARALAGSRALSAQEGALVLYSKPHFGALHQRVAPPRHRPVVPNTRQRALGVRARRVAERARSLRQRYPDRRVRAEPLARNFHYGCGPYGAIGRGSEGDVGPLPTPGSPDHGALCDARLPRQDGAMQGESKPGHGRRDERALAGNATGGRLSHGIPLIPLNPTLSRQEIKFSACDASRDHRET